MTFRLAHVTDPHFRGLTGLAPRDLLSKRLPGLVNAWLRRRRLHDMNLVRSLGEDLRHRGCDHLVVTGDLSNVGLAGEWHAALAWLQTTGAGPESVTVIPGNHDLYSRDIVASGAFERTFGSFQEAQLRPPGARYPFVRLRGRVALVGVNSCEPTPTLQSWGRVGEAQLRALGALLVSPEVHGCTRVVLIHHPPIVYRGGERRNLRDRGRFLEVISRAGAELVLHGHDHRDALSWLEGPGGTRIPVVGLGSASYAGRPEARARYNIYDLGPDGITSTTFAHDLALQRFREVKRQVLAGPPPAA